MKKSILLGNKSQIDRVYPTDVLEKLEKEAGLDISRIYTKQDLGEEARDVSYIFSTWGMPHFTKEEITDTFPKLKAVFYAAGSVQGFAREFLECGASVFSAWAANAVPVAEYVESQIILANKGFFSVVRDCSDSRDGYGRARKLFGDYPGNFSCKAGIIGAGMIGRMVIEALNKHNIKVCVCDPFLSEEKANEMGAEKCTIEELFSTCQTISNHVANNPQTVGMINYDLLKTMKKNATLINTGRGAQLVEDDLIRVLRERRDLTAVLDVTNPEPPEENSELYSLPNIILTPHMAGSSGLEVHRMAQYMLEEYESFAKNEKTRYSVTLKMLETMA